MSRVFINRRLLSDEAAAAILAIYPNGGMYSEEAVYRRIRSITKDMLPADCKKTPTQVRNEIDKLISEELTIQIAIEGLTCEKCERKTTAEDEHQKAMKKLADLAEKEHKAAANVEEPKKEEKPEPVSAPTPAPKPASKKPAAKKATSTTKKKAPRKKK